MAAVCEYLYRSGAEFSGKTFQVIQVSLNGDVMLLGMLYLLVSR